MKREVQANGQPGTLRVEGSHASYQREGADPIERDFEVHATEPGMYWVRLGNRSFQVMRSASGQVVVDGQRLDIEVYDPRNLRTSGRGASNHGRQEIVAPMPGKVVRVLVAVDEVVEEGQGVVVVEAMKMQNEMKSPKAGTVREVRTRTDATVAAGEVLLVIE